MVIGMTESNYSYVIEYGNTKFYKNGKFMTSSEVLNELEVKDMIINQFSEEINEVKKCFENCSGDEIAELFNDVNGKVGIDNYYGKLVNCTCDE